VTDLCANIVSDPSFLRTDALVDALTRGRRFIGLKGLVELLPTCRESQISSESYAEKFYQNFDEIHNVSDQHSSSFGKIFLQSYGKPFRRQSCYTCGGSGWPTSKRSRSKGGESYIFESLVHIWRFCTWLGLDAINETKHQFLKFGTLENLALVLKVPTSDDIVVDFLKAVAEYPLSNNRQ